MCHRTSERSMTTEETTARESSFRQHARWKPILLALVLVGDQVLIREVPGLLLKVAVLCRKAEVHE